MAVLSAEDTHAHAHAHTHTHTQPAELTITTVLAVSSAEHTKLPALAAGVFPKSRQTRSLSSPS